MSNTHYAVLVYTGDPAGEQDGRPPEMIWIAAGSEGHCWAALKDWTETHKLRRWETAEVLTRDPQTRPQRSR